MKIRFLLPAAILFTALTVAVWWIDHDSAGERENAPTGISTASPSAAVLAPSLPSAAPRRASTFRESPARPEPVPPKGVAKVSMGERVITPRNRVAHFERIKVGRVQEIPIEVSWPDDRTSTEVLAHAIHGGSIDRGTNARRIPLTPGEPVKFTFTSGNGVGLYQVLLRRGTQEEVLEFWVPTTHPKNDPPALN